MISMSESEVCIILFCPMSRVTFGKFFIIHSDLVLECSLFGVSIIKKCPLMKSSLYN